MARKNNPDSAQSQFYFNLQNNDSLNFTSATTNGFGYAVFGRVTQGIEILDQIETTQTQSISSRRDVPVTDIIIDKVEVVK
jgi:cyclophilin family peptidyl-prolyl cis-trans isomerase